MISRADSPAEVVVWAFVQEHDAWRLTYDVVAAAVRDALGPTTSHPGA